MKRHALFNEEKHLRNKNRAKRNFEKHNFLFKKSSLSIIERLSVVKKELKNILVLDDGIDTISAEIKQHYPDAKITNLSINDFQKLGDNFDCIISNLNLHWVNDLPSILQNIYSSLKPNGFFLASIFGNETLLDLRHSFIQAETKLYNSITPHISPAIDIKSLGTLLQKSRFLQPVIDCETYIVLHNNLLSLFHDLRGMGENNSLNSLSRNISKHFLYEIEKEYAKKCCNKEDLFETRFDILYMIGWKPQ